MDKIISPMSHIASGLKALDLALLEADKVKRGLEITRWQEQFRKIYDMPINDKIAEQWAKISEENNAAYAMYMLSMTLKRLK